MDAKQPSLFELVGGTPTLQRVHKIFYDKVYADPWLGQYFKKINQVHIENQQSDFMADAMGGPQNYSGAFPIPAHKHMNISDELFAHRHVILKAALDEAGVPSELAERWLKIDGAFRRGLVKGSVAECEKRYTMDEILDFPDPRKKAA